MYTENCRAKPLGHLGGRAANWRIAGVRRPGVYVSCRPTPDIDVRRRGGQDSVLLLQTRLGVARFTKYLVLVPEERAYTSLN